MLTLTNVTISYNKIQDAPRVITPELIDACLVTITTRTRKGRVVTVATSPMHAFDLPLDTYDVYIRDDNGRLVPIEVYA